MIVRGVRSLANGVGALAYTQAVRQSRPTVGTDRATPIRRLMLISLVALVDVGCTTTGMADCRPGDVTAKLTGFGPAMGTMYVLVGIAPTNGSCSLPASPNATGIDAAGSKVSVGRAPDIAAGSRVAVTTQGVGFRVAVNSWCDSAKPAKLDLVVDPSNGLDVSVALPADLAVACTGSATSLTMGAPVEPWPGAIWSESSASGRALSSVTSPTFRARSGLTAEQLIYRGRVEG
jgi:hypothetical protein